MFAKLKIKSIITIIGVFVLAGLLQPALWAGDGKVVTEEVAYYAGHDNIKGYLARPKTDKPAPAIILIHEWWGLTDWIRENARKFAELGYVALAVDLYKGKSSDDPKQARKLMMTVRQDMDSAFANLKGAVAYLKGKTKWVIPDRLSSIGWCFGGGWSYNMAKNDLGVKSSVIYYGYFNPKDDLSKMRAMILGNFGEKDRGISVDSVKEFQATLKTHNGNHEIYIYENAGHGFGRPGGRAYNKEAADLAWERTVKFLKKYL